MLIVRSAGIAVTQSPAAMVCPKACAQEPEMKQAMEAQSTDEHTLWRGELPYGGVISIWQVCLHGGTGAADRAHSSSFSVTCYSRGDEFMVVVVVVVVVVVLVLVLVLVLVFESALI